MSEIASIVGACIEHSDKSGTPCARCGSFRCADCLASGLCPPCREKAPLRAPMSEDAVGFGPRAGGRIVDLVFGFIGGFFGGIMAGIALAIMEVVGVASPGWAGRLDHGFLFNMMSGFTAGMLGGTLSTAICGASVGKLMFKLRVVDSSGARPGFGSAAIREAVYFIDSFFFGLVGKSAMDQSPLQQRHGDRMANTIVVRRDAASPQAQASGGRVAFGIFMGFAGNMIVIAIFTVLGAM